MKNTIQIVVFLAVVLTTLEGFSQQDPLYTQYYNNFSLINPAYAGNHGLFTATGNIRSQWGGVPDGPETQTLSVHGPAGDNVGLGFSVVHDKVYVLDETHLYADFSYTIEVSEKASLSFGIKGGGSFLNVDLLALNMSNDLLFSENINTFNPNIGAGAFYFTDKFYASASALNILKTEHFKNSDNIVSSASDEVVFYLASGYVFDLSQTLQLKPSVLVRAVNNSPVSTNISSSILWNQKAEFGMSYRIDEAVSFLFQLRLTDRIKMGYAYDAFTNDVNKENNGSHEISLVFNINKKTNNKRKSPFYWMGKKEPEKTINQEE
jgi:type IX secretion system PorP/SprF family membrane protein